MSVAARKSITAWSHFSVENSSEICTCGHLPAFQPVAFPTIIQSVFYWSFHQLQRRKRCSRVCTAPPLHHQHMSSSQCPNRFRYTPVGACPFFSLYNLAASDFPLAIGMGCLLPALPFSLQPQCLVHLSATHFAFAAVLASEMCIAPFAAEVNICSCNVNP